MGIMDKLKFWEREEELPKGMGNGGFENSFGRSGNPGFNDNFSGSDMGPREDPFRTGIPSSDFSSDDSFSSGSEGHLGSSFGGDSGFPRNDSLGIQRPESVSQMNQYNQSNQGFSQQTQASGNIEKDLELISLKIDNLKNLVENMNQRMMHIENSIQKEGKKDPWM